MGMWDEVRREHVLAAVHEYDDIGQQAFLERYGFGIARTYRLVVQGRDYDSKAILGAAYRIATGRPRSSSQFSGGVGHNGAARVLGRLGFDVRKTNGTLAGPTGTARPTGATVNPREAPDVVLVGCVKTKLHVAAPAEAMYTSPLFRRRRAFAEATGQTWYILSALYGLVAPDEVLEPYDMYLAGQSREYRRAWGRRVVDRLAAEVGHLHGKVVVASDQVVFDSSLVRGVVN